MEDPICGGLTEVDCKNNLEIEALARFAVEEHNKKEKRFWDNATLKYVNVVKAEVQVVSGFMYYITIEATNGDVKKKYDAKIWEKLGKDPKELEEFKEHVGDATGEASA